MNATKIETVEVTSKTRWTDTLFSFTVTRPASFRFTAGQFVRLGVNPSKLHHYQSSDKGKPALEVSHTKSDINADINADINVDSNTAINTDNNADNNAGIQTGSELAVDEEIFRAYSIVSSPYDEQLEFFSIVIPDGAFTSQLQHLQVGDELLLNTTPFGFLTLARYQKPAPKDLWLLATGTGVAPFLSMLQDLQPWQTYQQIVLAYSVRTESELAYLDKIKALVADFSQLVDSPAEFHFVPIVTRQQIDGALNKRLPALLTSGELQAHIGLSLSVDSTHVMLCGNPQMVEDTKDALKSLGLVMNRRGEGNIAVENYW